MSPAATDSQSFHHTTQPYNPFETQNVVNAQTWDRNLKTITISRGIMNCKTQFVWSVIFKSNSSDACYCDLH